MLIGAETSLRVGVVAVGIAAVSGVVIGLFAGFYRGWLDDALMRCMDVLFAFPAILLAIAILAIRGRGATNAMIAIGIVYIPIFARVTRASVLSVREEVYVRAARSVGAGDLRIMRRHVLPNVAAPIIVQTSVSLAFAILAEAALSFIGLGTQPPEPSWGRMLADGRGFIQDAWWMAVFPGLAIFAVVFSFNVLGRRAARRPRPAAALGHRVGVRRPVMATETDGSPGPVDGTTGGPALAVADLEVQIRTRRGTARVVNGVSWSVDPGETLAIVGESGSGKSVSVLSLLGLVPRPPATVTGTATFDGQDLLALSEEALRKVRGPGIGMVFQDPMTSLNPVLTIGRQLTEGMQVHLGLGRRQAEERAAELLALVGIPSPRDRLRTYPHQLSGGMRQRVMIAIALSCDPAVLIADEATTALDVTIQAQIVELIADLQRELGMAVVWITPRPRRGRGHRRPGGGHVRRAGASRRRPVDDLYADPRHPYTQGLLASLPVLGRRRVDLDAIPGLPPDPLALPAGLRVLAPVPGAGRRPLPPRGPAAAGGVGRR